MTKFKEMFESDQQNKTKMEKLIKELYRLNDRWEDESGVQSEIEKYLDSIEANLEMVEN